MRRMGVIVFALGSSAVGCASTESPATVRIAKGAFAVTTTSEGDVAPTNLSSSDSEEPSWSDGYGGYGGYGGPSDVWTGGYDGYGGPSEVSSTDGYGGPSDPAEQAPPTTLCTLPGRLNLCRAKADLDKATVRVERAAYTEVGGHKVTCVYRAECAWHNPYPEFACDNYFVDGAGGARHLAVSVAGGRRRRHGVQGARDLRVQLGDRRHGAGRVQRAPFVVRRGGTRRLESPRPAAIAATEAYGSGGGGFDPKRRLRDVSGPRS